jgi:hypothetical protein
MSSIEPIGRYLNTPVVKSMGSYKTQEELPLRFVTTNREWAVLELVSSPLWIPLKSIISVAMAVSDIVFFGSESKIFDPTLSGVKQRSWAVLLSAVSIPAILLAAPTELVCSIAHIVNPQHERLDKIATILWTGGKVSFNDTKLDLALAQLKLTLRKYTNLILAHARVKFALREFKKRTLANA